MKKAMWTLAVALLLIAVPLAVQAQLSEVNQAITELNGGADISKCLKAGGILQDALSKTTDPKAKALLEGAVAYAKAGMHKEARLQANGAKYYLCAGGSGEGCDKVAKFGSYFAP